MRALATPPVSFVDPRTRAPAFGAYRGPLPPIEGVPLGVRERFARRKRWVYVAFASDEAWVAIAVVRTGYAATAFGFVYDLRDERMLADETAIAPALAARVAHDPHADGDLASFAFGRSRVAMTRRRARVDVTARLGPIAIDASFDESGAPPAVAAIARLDSGSLWNATEKRALARAEGRVACDGRELSLEGARAGYDYTHGLMPRHTVWRWAFALGEAEGAPIAFNLVSGFVGQAECAAFMGDRVEPLGEPRFVFDAARPLEPWRLEGDGVDLVFQPGAVHAQTTKLVVVRSRFLQPVGAFRGTLRIGGRDVRLEGVPGVVEDQDVHW